MSLFNNLFNKMKIRGKVLSVLLTVSLLSLLINTSVAYWSILSLRSLAENSNKQLGADSAGSSMRALEDQAVGDLALLIGEKADHIGTKLDKLEDDTRLTTYFISSIYNNPSEYTPIVPDKATDIKNKDILALQYTLAPGILYSDIRAEIERVCAVKTVFAGLTNENSNILTIYYGTESGGLIAYDAYSGYSDSIYFEHRERTWYRSAKETGSLVWTDVYRDSFDRGLVITCAMPVYNADGLFTGVFAMDVSLSDLDKVLVESKIGENGYIFMIDESGNLLSSPDYEEKNLLDDENKDFAEAVGHMINGESGHSLLRYMDEDIYLSYTPLPHISWSIGVILPRDEIIAPAVETADLINRNSEEILARMSSAVRNSLLIFAGLFALVLILVIMTSIPFSKLLTSPIAVLLDGVKAIGGGNLTYDVEIHTGDEIETLSSAFYVMTLEIQQYIDSLATVTAEKERIGAELSIATQIQASMLPCIFPAFPDRPEFDIYASMQPAKEVGGDFYDFFLVDENTLAVVIADVSGKGVPAALFMVIAKTLIKNNAQYGKSPKEVFETVNNLLCENNEAGMFVTAFLGYLDIPSGRFTFVNAGHNPPLVRFGGRYDWLPSKPGFVLAGMEDMFYKQSEIILKPGEELFLYTDGVTEAVNNQNKLFSDPRLLETANSYPGLALKQFTVSIKREIDRFAEGAEQADDITMLALRYKGQEETKK